MRSTFLAKAISGLRLIPNGKKFGEEYPGAISLPKPYSLPGRKIKRLEYTVNDPG